MVGVLLVCFAVRGFGRVLGLFCVLGMVYIVFYAVVFLIVFFAVLSNIVPNIKVYVLYTLTFALLSFTSNIYYFIIYHK
jgi:hypothetical protein